MNHGQPDSPHRRMPCVDHEARIRSLEKFRYQAQGALHFIAIASGSGIVAAIVALIAKGH